MSDRAGHSVRERDVGVRVGDVSLPGVLGVPEGAVGVVVFCHGSGSSRHSSRNRFVADRLRERGMGTLLFDLLTEAEGEDRRLVFDIALLAERVEGAVGWLRGEVGQKGAIGLFGASTGAAAALVAAARGAAVEAVVSRGGRPDLAGRVLGSVRAPTLLIIGGADRGCLALNEEALARLRCECAMEVVPGATHLFEEPGTLERAAELAGDWFERHFGACGDGEREEDP